MPDRFEEIPGRELVVIISDRAATKLAEAVAWYEAERAGLGLEFLDAVDAVCALLLRHPEIGIEVRPRIRRALLRRFPYGVFYSLHEHRVRLLAVLHSRRHPARWPRRA